MLLFLASDGVVMKYAARVLFVFLMVPLLMAGGTSSVPRNIDNACEILTKNKRWLEASRQASQRWQVPMEVLLAFIHTESKFKSNAKSPRKRYLWVVPGPRLSSAYGYAQAINGTWGHYKSVVGKPDARRDQFSDAVDFVGWYVDKSKRMNGISKADAYNQYLAYHEGHRGFSIGRYKVKTRIQQVANQARQRTEKFKSQLARCAI